MLPCFGSPLLLFSFKTKTSTLISNHTYYNIEPKMKHFKALSFAYWNDFTDNIDVSQNEINQCLKEGLLIRSPNTKKATYWITEKGLELFKTTKSYKTASPDLNC